MSIQSLVATGTKVWLDSIDPDLIKSNKTQGATGATSNPIIVADLVATGRFDELMKSLFDKHPDDESVAWAMTDKLVSDAQAAFKDVWEKTGHDDGWVSFELDPLLEDVENSLPHAERVKRYIALGKQWGEGQKNRMIKVPATSAGIDALEELAAAGLTLNVTLIFSERQYKAAREAVWKGAQRRKDGLDLFKSVYSIFVSRVDVYTAKHVPELIPEAQGLVGIVNVKHLWRMNQEFWASKNLPLKQEIIFASTGTKDPKLPADKYVEALAGSDIQTNPPATNAAVEKLGKTYTRQVDKMPAKNVVDDIAKKVSQEKLEQVLMEEGTAKFAEPFKKLLATIASKRAELKTGSKK
jgi:transaldolase